MFVPDPSTVKIWAFWDFRRTPWYSLYDYQHYIPSHGLYIFKERKSQKLYSLSLQQIGDGYKAGQFKPFVLILAKETPKAYA